MTGSFHPFAEVKHRSPDRTTKEVADQSSTARHKAVAVEENNSTERETSRRIGSGRPEEQLAPEFFTAPV